MEAFVTVDSLWCFDASGESAGEVSHYCNFLINSEHWVLDSLLSRQESGTRSVHSHADLHRSSADPVSEHGWDVDFANGGLRIKTCGISDEGWVDEVRCNLSCVDTLGILAPLPAGGEVSSVTRWLMANTNRLTIDHVVRVPRVHADQHLCIRIFVDLIDQSCDTSSL